MHTQPMLKTHPLSPFMDREALSACIDECFACAQACTACADACLAEDHVKMLIRCIRLNLDCADICGATGRMLSRQSEPSPEVLRAQLQSCAMACRVCGEECKKHAQMHGHCRVCAESCHQCEEACNRVLAAI